MSLREYETYRDAGMTLNGRIMARSLGRDVLGRAATLLGIGMDGSGAPAFKTELEEYAALDLALFDLRGSGGRTPAQAYMEDVGPDGGTERALLEARINSRTSLFRIEGSDAGRGTVSLSDLLHGGGGVAIYNKGMSMTARAGNAIFTRLFRLPELNTGSGIVFSFFGGSVPALVGRYRAMRSRRGRRGPVSRYVLFYKMYRRHGMPTLFAD